MLYRLEYFIVYCNNKARNAELFFEIVQKETKNIEYSGRKDRENNPVVIKQGN
jgi:hypothetical protein